MSLSRPGEREGTFSALAVVRINANTGKVESVASGQGVRSVPRVRPRCAGIVLAGGRSTRMGRPKAALEWHGSTLLRRVVGLVGRGVDGSVVVVRAPGQQLPALPEDVVLATDAREDRGPLEGLAAGAGSAAGRSRARVRVVHRRCRCSAAFVRAVLRAAEREDADVALPVVHGFRHTLAAAYAPRCCPSSSACWRRTA